jgi:hypothetical protein
VVPQAKEAPLADRLARRHTQSAYVTGLFSDLLECSCQLILLASLRTGAGIQVRLISAVGLVRRRSITWIIAK